jgi:translocation and assembly module TamA
VQRTVLLLWVATSWLASAARAADPQPYTVTVQPTGTAALDAALRQSSQLEVLRTGAPVGPFALIGRAQQDLERLGTVLDSYGYYARRLTITIDGRGLDDPGLPDIIAAQARTDPAKVNVAIELGPLYHLRAITLDGEVDAVARKAMDLESGAAAVAADVLGARDRLLSALQNEGRALATVDAPIAFEDATAPLLDVSFKVNPGPKVNIGEIRLTGLHRVHEAYIRKRLLLHQGELYSASALERARTDLLSLGVFSSVTVQPAQELDAQGQLPVTFELQERLGHAINLNAAYSSDLGGSFGATWTARNVFGNGEQLNLTANAIDLGGNDTTGVGYNVGAQLILPDLVQRDLALQLALTALKQNLIAYDQTALVGSVLLNRKISSVWHFSVGLTLEQERILQEGVQDGTPPCTPIPDTDPPVCPAVRTDYTLFAIPITGKYDTTDLPNPLDDPLHGMRATLSIAPTESLGNGHATFVVIQGNVSTYFDLQRLGWTQRGRSVIALRALAGLAYGAKELSLPPDQRFYAGGSATVRGYQYQSVGPQFPDRNPIGGTAIEAGSVELRQRFGQNFGAAVFMDAGEVTATTRPLQGTLSVGYGAGLRYYTPIGPIRLDLALPTTRPPGGSAFEVYVGLGQAF